MPAFLRSIRVRIAVVYSAIVFGLGAIVLGGVYLALRNSLAAAPVSRDLVVSRVTDVPGPFVAVEQQVVRQTFISMERLVNANTLDKLQDVSLVILVGLFPMALVIGWLVAGRALRPIERITGVAREIQATDLTRRIRLQGADDELKHLADTFDAMLDRIEAGADAQRAFIQETSHELRNPLAIMATNLDVAIGQDDPAELRQAAGVVRRTIDRMSHTVDGLLAYGRSEAPVTRTERFEVESILQQTAAEFSVTADARQIDLVVDVAPGLTVEGDRTALLQAVENLAGNAVRLAPLASTITLSAGTTDTWSWIAVGDEGPGIPAGQRQLVWQRHWRGGSSPDTTRGGLGLAVVRQVAEAHGGEAHVHSAVGEGSTFVIWLPTERAVDEPAPRANPLAH
jgi:signal transduction histidine kinase